jgi:hypothetical protein
MLSPALAELNRDAFVIDEHVETSVDLDTHGSASGLDALELGEPRARDRLIGCQHLPSGPRASGGVFGAEAGGARHVQTPPEREMISSRRISWGPMAAGR